MPSGPGSAGASPAFSATTDSFGNTTGSPGQIQWASLMYLFASQICGQR